ncbi:microcystin-dependent protein [Desulfosporosinus orientis DSM 765]|uniref:Microcystin-dependent protein n=2 Tax=Desulfosporosinus orientis TaxID=1563 RepID=G7WG93_DESOD|nr:microcystin-dependent protein [Desulfosporosinus orientis DSM 765]
MIKRFKMITIMFLMLGVSLAYNMAGPKPAMAAVEPFIGEISLVPYNFAPRGWAFCEGQLLPISQNQALFSLLGTTYGGDGVTTFALPDLRGRLPIGVGVGPGLSNYNLGETGGTETVTLTNNNMPMHNHQINAITSPGNSSVPGPNEYLAQPQTPDRQEIDIYASGTPNTQLTSTSTSPSGGSQPISIMQPYLGLHYIIALEGIYPTRD